jgi:fluoroacetyl-CoA thioesterase
MISEGMSQIPAGLRGNSRIVVTDENAISFLGREDARVLATPWLIGYMEMTARNAVKPFLLDAEDTVGTQVSIRHLAACPLGSEVDFEAEVIRVENRRVEFRVTARDAAGTVGEGTHERAIIDMERFAAKVRSRRS